MFSLVGCIAIAVTRPLTAWLTPVVCPLGIGAGPSGVHGASRLAGMGGGGRALAGGGPETPAPRPAPAAPRVGCSPPLLFFFAPLSPPRVPEEDTTTPRPPA